MNRWREYLTTLVLAVLFALFVRSFLLTAYKVPTGSMQPTLKSGDFIFSSRLSYGVPMPFSSQRWNEIFPERGDLVVFTYPESPTITYVKRVVALPGDKVQISQGRLSINDQPLEYRLISGEDRDNPNPQLFDIFEEKSESHIRRVIFQKQSEEKDFGPLVVPPGEVFLLGDNRDASDDSRYWGTVPMDRVVGEVVLIWLSLDWQKKWGGDRYPSVRWERVFSSVQ
ncbi:signal peptidase I [Bdellovibrio bacteriovorus]|uniref:Signal peptidase I n=1 Tax=Bdellovibrio bacteriovorus TaxID=959 RepID=A0A150WSQ6_BDEBC|nr:signal peptidase I [Bdellovibrio bacteriovorus]KYG67397.1 signal peptidase I [Bdellovibrio bacteriovorus]